MFKIEDLLSKTLKTYVCVFDKNSIRYSSKNISLPLQPESLLDSNFWELLYTYVHSEDIPKVTENLFKLKAGKLANDKVSFIYRIVYDEKLYYIQCHLTTLEEKGEQLYAVLNVDITDQIKEKEDELHYEQERFSALASKAPIGIFQLDTTGSFVYCNNEFSRITNKNLEDLKGESLLSLIRADYLNEVSKNIQKAFTPVNSSYESGEFQAWCITDKEEKLINFKYNPLINGRFRGIICIAQDMTSSYRLYEHLQCMTKIPMPV